MRWRQENGTEATRKHGKGPTVPFGHWEDECGCILWREGPFKIRWCALRRMRCLNWDTWKVMPTLKVMSSRTVKKDDTSLMVLFATLVAVGQTEQLRLDCSHSHWLVCASYPSNQSLSRCIQSTVNVGTLRSLGSKEPAVANTRLSVYHSNNNSIFASTIFCRRHHQLHRLIVAALLISITGNQMQLITTFPCAFFFFPF